MRKTIKYLLRNCGRGVLSCPVIHKVRNTKNMTLLSIVVFSILVRFVAIDNTPPSLNWDEVSHGYNAYSLLSSGYDEWGKKMPTIFRAYGDYKLPVYIYVTALSEKLFGVNTLAVRLPSMLAGVGLVIVSYFLTHTLFQNEIASKERLKNLSLLTAFLVAIEPWTLFLSRAAFEANLALFFITFATYLLISAEKKYMNLVWSAVFFGLAVWTYNSARIFVPLFVVILVLGYRLEIAGIYLRNVHLVKFSFIILFFFTASMFAQLVNPAGQARYSKVEIVDEGAIAQIDELRNSSPYSPFIARALHNKGTFFIKKAASNWTSHFKGDYLFTDGGSQYQFSVPKHGLLYIINAIFLVIGVFALLRLKNRVGNIILFWFFVGPIASSITREAPHVLRSSTMLPSPMIITAFGYLTFMNFVNKGKRITLKNMAWIITPIYIFLIILSAENYLHGYFTSYRSNYSWSWQYGYQQVVQYTKQYYYDYDKIIVTKKYGEPHEFFLFYGGVGGGAPWRWKPESYRNDPNLIRFEQTEWFWVDAFDKFYFVNDWQIKSGDREENHFVLESGGDINCNEIKCLLITSPGNMPSGWKKYETVYFLNNEPAFEIYANQ
ncbi:glycosyltransferase family 39 protein [Candidatus Woesebacteria bacterium]|nr:MAG: glycosyltransferase family 39 protein [Candidatus Woesebacteria bacterium]